MKIKFTTLDIRAILPELNERCKGLRVVNVYNVNNKTYLFKLSKNNTNDPKEDEDANKNFLLLESGFRIHLTEYDWPKEAHPNGFTMKLRKHIKNKRIEYIKQLGYDRIIDIQFGINEAAYHIILELYDRGNIIFTDCNFIILNLLRKEEREDVKFVVKEIYPIEKYENSITAKTLEHDQIREIIKQSKVGANLAKLFLPVLKIYAPSLLSHCFIESGLKINFKIDKDSSVDIDKIYNAIQLAKEITVNVANQCEGYIVQKEEENVLVKNGDEKQKIISFLEFNPVMFAQYKNLDQKGQNLIKFESFNKAVDIFFSSIESQKIDNSIYKQEKNVMKKLDNIKRDHEKRLQDLEEKQKIDNRKGYLIQLNNEIVEKALFILRSALSRQMSWTDIKQMLKEAQEAGDVVASKIYSLKFDVNAFTMLLDDPYDQDNQTKDFKSMKVDISLDLSAHGNARKYFEERKYAKKKEDKTIEASSKALKNAKIKTAKALKEVQIKSSIVKSRKVLWFEKFFWFISSENYIVIAGRDAQQNELIVKKYMKKSDLYVHADLHGASSVVIKNRSSTSKIPSKTIEEAGCFAVCYSNAWELKTPVRAWWVNADQVSKTAPSGEYLTIGSFMIRGKKNFLPQTQLVMGFSFFFRLAEESIANHENDRKIKYVEPKTETIDDSNLDELEEDEQMKAFPDTKIRTMSNSEAEQEVILEAMKSKFKAQRKLKIEKDNKREEREKELLNAKSQQPVKKSNTKNKKGKGKGKRNKKDDWSDDEDKIMIKLNKKIQKDNRLQDLENETTMLSLDDGDDSEEDNDDNDTNEKESDIAKINESNQVDASSSSQSLKNEVDKEEEILEPQKDQNESSSSDEERVVEEEEEEEEEVDEETNEERREIEYLKIVNSLTGQPLSEDVLLYCVPVVAPYQSVVNCKYKVKVTPGISKRGRSAKTAIQVFLNEKHNTPRERDLIKSMKDQDIARNLPDRIKITAPHLQQVKRKK